MDTYRRWNGVSVAFKSVNCTAPAPSCPINLMHECAASYVSQKRPQPKKKLAFKKNLSEDACNDVKLHSSEGACV
jgi:hypothetical protein